MGRSWRIMRAAVEQEILFPSKEVYDFYIAGLERKQEPFEVLSVVENEDGTLVVLMRKRYNPQNPFLWKGDDKKEAR